MSNEQDLIEFDDQDAIDFILKQLPEELRASTTEEDVQYVLDLICDYYEQNDLIEEDAVGEATIAEEEMFLYIQKAIKQEKMMEISDEQLQMILEGEYEYGKSIGIYTDAE